MGQRMGWQNSTLAGFPVLSGPGTPNGHITPPTVPAFYVDETTPGFYMAMGPTNTDWVALASNSLPATDTGIQLSPGVTANLSDGAGDSLQCIPGFGVVSAAADGSNTTVGGGFSGVSPTSDSFTVGSGTIDFTNASGFELLINTTGVNLGKSPNFPLLVTGSLVSVTVGFGLQINGETTLWSSAGVPSAATGSNGDVSFRFNTPGTLGQRQYIKSAGAWVAETGV